MLNSHNGNDLSAMYGSSIDMSAVERWGSEVREIQKMKKAISMIFLVLGVLPRLEEPILLVRISKSPPRNSFQ